MYWHFLCLPCFEAITGVASEELDDFGSLYGGALCVNNDLNTSLEFQT